jgi:ABC-type multidrug transport system fused ATPase/permease subunit
MASRKRNFNSNGKAEDETPKAKITRESLREMLFVFGYLKPYKTKFILGLIFIALSAFSTMIFPFLLGKMIDSATVSQVKLPGEAIQALKGNASMNMMSNWNLKDMNFSMNTLLLLIFIQLIVQMVFSFMRIYLLTEVGERSLADLRSDLFSKLLTMPMSFYSERRVGELSSRMSSDLSQIQDTVSFQLAEFLRGIFTMFIGLAAIFWLSAELALVMLAVVPVIAVLAVVFGVKIRKMSRKAQDQLADSGTIIQEAFQGIATVKAFTNEGFERNRYAKSIYSVVSIAISNARYRGAFVSFMIFSVFGAIGFVMWYGVKILPPGELTMFVIFSVFVGGTIAGFADLFSQLQKTIGATQRVREIMKETGESVNFDPFSVAFEFRLKGEVVFKNIAFSYPSRKEMKVLADINIHAMPGEQIAIVGPSGAGKSTLTALILQFYKPDSGVILFDGIESSVIPLTQIRSQMALVPQDVMLFGGTIYENIIYGKPEATKAQVEDAANKANAHEFISQFPEGYETIVGERGVKLSGGQRQRIAIARAVLKDPAILILDEATSSLDSESEKLVQEALENLMKNRTSFVIAHRLSTVRNADRIIVIQNGYVTEIGTHAQLIQRADGMYKRLVDLQFQE